MKEHPCKCEKCLLALSHAKEEGRQEGQNTAIIDAVDMSAAGWIEQGREEERQRIRVRGELAEHVAIAVQRVTAAEISRIIENMHEYRRRHPQGVAGVYLDQIAADLRSLSDLPPKEPYNQRDHAHCFNEQKGHEKHLRCCLCQLPPKEQ